MKKNLPLILYLMVSLLIVLIWFRDGHIFAGGDVGFQTFNPERILENARFVWWDSTAPGAPLPQNLTAIPLQFILFLFQSVGFSPLYVQATFFFVLLFAMGFGMYLFLEQRFENRTKIYPFIGGVFYMFNPFMMIQVWHRFIHTTIILAAVLPFFAIFWNKWIKEGSIKYLLFFLITNILAVYIYGTYAYIVTVWIFLLLLTITALVPWQNRRNLFKVSARFLFGFTVWIFVNGWWLVPVTKISPAILSEVHKTEDSILTLIGISSYAVLPYTLQLVNPFYPFYQAEFGESYKSPLLQVLPWIFVGVIMIGFMQSFKTRNFALYGIFYLISIFLAKGAAPPLGFLYIFGFQNIFALGVLRNPFEKTGLILVFFATVLFVLGLQRIKNKLILMVILITVLIFSWPMILGKVFGSISARGDVEVPQSYRLADTWLRKQGVEGILDGNILHLPLTRGESVRYDWDFGYNGLESSDQFFTSYPSLSRGFNIQRIDDSLTALSLIFLKPYSEDKDKILNLLQVFNVRFIVLHKDLNWLGSDVYSPIEAEKVLNNLNFIEKKAEYGNLVIYQVADQFFGPKIAISNNISLVYPQNANMKVWPWLANKGNSFFISSVNDNNLDPSLSSVKNVLIFPKYKFIYPEISENLDEIKQELVSRLNNMLSSVQYLKQQGNIQINTEETVQNFINSSDKLVRIEQAFISKTPVFQLDFDEYVNTMEKIFPQLVDNSTIYFDISRNNIDDILKYHSLLLAELDRQLGATERIDIIKAQELIKGILSKKNILPSFVVFDKTTEFGQREYNKFLINSGGKYELLLSNSETKDAYVNSLSQIDFQINDKEQILTGKVSGNLISFGEIDLNNGLNEISLTYPAPINLISPLENLTRIGDVKLAEKVIQMNATQTNPSMIESPLGGISGEDIYQVSFDVQLPTNSILYLQILQDSDPEVNGQKAPRINIPITQSQPVQGWQSYSAKLPSLSLTTREVAFRLIAVVPSDQNSGSVETILLRNLRVLRVLNNEIFLRRENLRIIDEASSSGQIIGFKKISPVEYQGEINLSKPGYVFFKETYHPGWKLQLTKDNLVTWPKDHYLGGLYGNAWYIERTGQYKFKIFFEPENSFYQGFTLSVIGVFSLCAYKVLKRKKEK